MHQATPTATSNVGFITSLNEEGAFTGGYLVTNDWGRPLEFRVSSSVTPTRVQRILYGETLEPYVLADLIGSSLLNKAATSVSWILTDQSALVALRGEISVPLAYVTNDQVTRGERSSGLMQVAHAGEQFVFCHEAFACDIAFIQSRLACCRFDLLEPFERIAAAIREAERLGAGKDTDRAA